MPNASIRFIHLLNFRPIVFKYLPVPSTIKNARKKSLENDKISALKEFVICE